MPNVGSPALNGAFNPFEGGGATLTSVYLAPAPSGGDDYATIQALLTSIGITGGAIWFPAGVYLFSQELQIPSGLTHKLALVGSGAVYDGGVTGTVFKATASMRSVLAVLSSGVDIDDIQIDANRTATNGMYWDGASLCRFRRVYVYNALIHGILSSALLLNQDNYLEMCATQSNGTTYVTAGIAAQMTFGARSTIAGTATTVSGNGVVNIVGGPDLTTLGIHLGSILRVGNTAATAFYGQITSVTSTAITLTPVSGGNTPSFSGSGFSYAIGVGDGYHEDRAGSNGYCLFLDCVVRLNGNVGYFVNALYGDTIIHGQVDYHNLFGYEFGSSGPVLGVVVDHVYSEGNTGDFMLIAVRDLDIRDPTENSAIFMIGDTAVGQSGTITRGGQVEQIGLGANNNFAIGVQNLAGQLQVRFLGDMWGATAPARISKLNAPPIAFTNLPAITAVVGFGAAGAGVLVASPLYLLLDTPNAQPGNMSMTATVEANSTGTDLGASFSTISQNINGVTINRTGIFLMNRTTGARVNWDTTTIPAGTFVFVRVDGMFR
jgi:hypothetical protein